MTEIAVKLEEGVTILLSSEKIEKLVRDNYGENAVMTKKDLEQSDVQSTQPAVETEKRKYVKSKTKRSFKSWKISEEKKLIHFFKKYGSNAESRKEIAGILNRSEASIRIRYNKIQRGEVKVEKKTPEEYGFKKKSLVFDGGSNQAKDSPETKNCEECGNTFERMKSHNDYIWNKRKYCNDTCRARSHQKFSPKPAVEGMNKKWTVTEDETIMKEVKAGGRTMNNYTRIGKLLGRTMSSVQARYSIMSRNKKKDKGYGEAVKGVECPECKSTHIRNKGLQHNKDHDIKRYQCGYCRKYFYGEKIPVKIPVDLEKKWTPVKTEELADKIKNMGGING